MTTPDPLDKSLTPEQQEAAWEASWHEIHRELERIFGPDDERDQNVPYRANQDWRRSEFWDDMWMDSYEENGAEWADRYARAHMGYALQLLYGVKVARRLGTPNRTREGPVSQSRPSVERPAVLLGKEQHWAVS